MRILILTLFVVMYLFSKPVFGESKLVSNDEGFNPDGNELVEALPTKPNLKTPYLGKLSSLEMEVLKEDGKVFRKYLGDLESKKASYLVGIPVKIHRESSCQFYVGQETSNKKRSQNITHIRTLGARDALGSDCTKSKASPVETFIAVEFNYDQNSNQTLIQTVFLDSEKTSQQLLVKLNTKTEEVSIESVR